MGAFYCLPNETQLRLLRHRNHWVRMTVYVYCALLFCKVHTNLDLFAAVKEAGLACDISARILSLQVTKLFNLSFTVLKHRSIK